MPSKKKKYNARFPAGRIKKIMQTDEEIGKVAQAVPVIISRTLELFVESLLTKSTQITQARNAKTLTPSHMKQCILSESRFDFLKDLVKNIPDASIQEDNENNAMFDTNSDNKTDDIEMVVNQIKGDSSPEMCSPKLEIAADYYTEQSSSSSRTPVIQYGPKIAQTNTSPSSDSKINFSVKNILKSDSDEPKLHITIASEEVPSGTATTPTPNSPQKLTIRSDNVPPLIPISHNLYGQNVGDNLCIDEDYDN